MNICKKKSWIYSFLCHSGLRKIWENNWSIILSLLSFLPCLFRHFHNLQNLSLAYCRGFTDKGLQYLNLGNGCHKLIYLDLSGCTQVCLLVFSLLRCVRKFSRERAAFSPHVILMLCTDCSTLFRGFKLHGPSCWNFPQDLYYRLLASFHWSVTQTNRQSSLDEETDHSYGDSLSTILKQNPSPENSGVASKTQTKESVLRENFARDSWKVN